MAPIHRPHAHGVRHLNTVLFELTADRAIVDIQNALVLDGHSQVSPDVMLLRPRDDGYRELPTADDVRRHDDGMLMAMGAAVEIAGLF